MGRTKGKKCRGGGRRLSPYMLFCDAYVESEGLESMEWEAQHALCSAAWEKVPWYLRVEWHQLSRAITLRPLLRPFELEHIRTVGKLEGLDEARLNEERSGMTLAELLHDAKTAGIILDTALDKYCGGIYWAAGHAAKRMAARVRELEGEISSPTTDYQGDEESDESGDRTD